ncbi:heterokaryon incompatibility protein-domain-containing protein [Apiospora sp. TS-2023a]
MTSNCLPSVCKEIDLLPSSDNSLPEGKGHILDTDWVNLYLLHEWKSECLTKHGQDCSNPVKITQVHPAWLIDTFNDCLVPGEGIRDFVALSYVWGVATWLRNERAILQALQQPGALSQRLSDQVVSPKIRSAMGLTRALEERYLWADALCVIQDDGEHSAHQLRLMGNIYASAKITIVAADGDAAESIAGIKGVSHTRNLSQMVLPVASNRKIIIRDGYSGMGERYFNRAWTFQEYALSQRVIMVKQKRFHWICSTHSIREGSAHHHIEPSSSYRFDSPKVLSGYPDLTDELRQAMSAYNGRTLSVPLDALAGATGILEILSRAFEGGFLYGLPLMYFHAALMWISQTPMKRRVHSGKQHSILPGSRLPSWSWIGWETSVFAFGENDGTLKDSNYATYGLTKWYNHETPTSSDKRAIGPCFPNIMNGVDDEDFNSHLGCGWTAHKYSPYTDGPGNMVRRNTVYRHSSMPDKVFWYWFPIKDRHNDKIYPTPPQHAFISCKTKRGTFRTARSYRLGDIYIAAVFDKYEKRCGELRLPSEEEWTGLPAESSGQYQTIELAATCLLFHPTLTKKEKYGVLWVEWGVDGVAYRKAAGEVDKEAWEQHDLEDVDLVLG